MITGGHRYTTGSSFTPVLASVVVVRLTGKKVALKEIRLQPEEGTPFTAIREGWCLFNLHAYMLLHLISACYSE